MEVDQESSLGLQAPTGLSKRLTGHAHEPTTASPDLCRIPARLALGSTTSTLHRPHRPHTPSSRSRRTPHTNSLLRFYTQDSKQPWTAGAGKPNTGSELPEPPAGRLRQHAEWTWHVHVMFTSVTVMMLFNSSCQSFLCSVVRHGLHP